MAISAPTKSAQYTNRTATPPVLNDGRDSGPLHVKLAKLTFTAAGFTSAAAGDLKLERMPAGKVRVYRGLSWVVCPVGTGTSDFDLGIGAYTKADGTTQALAGAALAGSLDVGGAALNQNLITGSDALASMIEVESKSGWDLVCSFDTANSPAAGDLILILVYTHAGLGA